MKIVTRAPSFTGRRRLLLLLAFSILLGAWTVDAYRWEDEDTITIEAGEQPPSSSSSRVKRHFVTDYDENEETNSLEYAGGSGGSGYSGQCLTRNGEVGVCAALSDCYPVLYTLPVIRGERNITNNPLAEDLLRSSGPCSNNPLDFMDNVICCPTFWKSRTPVRPKYPQQQREAPTPPNCGTTKVVGGSQDTVQGTFPWMAALMQRGRQFCGGSLIDDYHVITAAHCVSHMSGADVQNLRILLGAHDLYSALEPGRVTASAARVNYHRSFSHQTLLYDIAVIRLAQPVKYWNYRNINAICLTNGIPAYDRNWPSARLAGWGKLRDRGPVPSRLQDTYLKVWPNDVCRRHYGRIPRGGIQDHNVCASAGYGGNGPVRDACQGDSGGPLMRFANNHVEQIGVVSWGVNCGDRGFPGVYTRVDFFRDWLNKNRLS